ncbi:hypothetical protein [Actinomadura sp. 6N118]|uniref:hypothetical protein n=1 Tax=Actinomadura sp. 6N118 TaxID=3375151 RepID=UPI0037A7971E
MRIPRSEVTSLLDKMRANLPAGISLWEAAQYVSTAFIPESKPPRWVTLGTDVQVQAVSLNPALWRGSTRSRLRKDVPQVIEDAPDGEGHKPDPYCAKSMDDLLDLLQEFWAWAGEYSSRRVAANSGGRFSHTTATKIMYRKAGVKLTQEYVRGMIRGCGGSEAEEMHWVTAFRRIRKAERREEARRGHLRALPAPGTATAVQ